MVGCGTHRGFLHLEYPHAPACPQPVRCVLTECAPYKIRRAQGGRIAITFYTVRNTPLGPLSLSILLSVCHSHCQSLILFHLCDETCFRRRAGQCLGRNLNESTNRYKLTTPQPQPKRLGTALARVGLRWSWSPASDKERRAARRCSSRSRAGPSRCPRWPCSPPPARGSPPPRSCPGARAPAPSPASGRTRPGPPARG